MIPPTDPLSPGELAAVDALIGLALTEDLGEQGDITANATIPSGAQGSAWFVARQEGVIAGLPIVARLAARMGIGGGFIAALADGESIEAGTRVASVFGRMRTLLAFERTALNFLQHLSGIATLTARYVSEVAGTKAIILDTRKTLPGWRLLEKYAVRSGGGHNHRIGLFDGVLIKDNHLAWLEHCGDPIGTSVASARASTPSGTVIEVEVDDLEQLDSALASSPDIILLDNFDPSMVSESVRRRDAVAPRIRLEASGGVTLRTVRALAQAGIDRISVGAITHSAPILDIGLDFEAVVAE